MHFAEDIINYDVTTLYLLSLFAVFWLLNIDICTNLHNIN
jgi:hypothetical protein